MTEQQSPVDPTEDASAQPEVVVRSLDNLPYFISVLYRIDGQLWPAGGQGSMSQAAEPLYCPTCGGNRRVMVRVIYPRGGNIVVVEINELPEQLVPSLFSFECLQCSTKFLAVIYQGPQGPSMALFPQVHGGLSRPNAPEAVTYYLDQAHRCENVGAFSAAIAMYRSALENLLFEQGYKKGMLASKIQQLEADVAGASPSAPRWARDLETEYLTVIKELGNASIHPNDGDITKQEALDRDLVAVVREVFAGLLYLVYELPQEKSSRLASLRAKVGLLKK